jgi:hypothetical protein
MANREAGRLANRVAAEMAESVEGGGEHRRERTAKCVSAGAEPTTHGWPVSDADIIG